MPKFVCDYGQVTSAGEKLIQAGNTLKSATSTYASKIDSDLSGWTGDAKNSFMTSCKSQTDAATQKAEKIAKFGEFVKTGAQKIQELDDQLAALSL